jgi:hypothetical protein
VTDRAGLSSEAGIAVFKVAFQRSVEDRDGPTLARVIEETADELPLVTSGEDPVIVDR